MNKSKKYDFRVEQQGATWKAQITRQVTSKKTVISKEQDAFTSEAQAREWAEQQVLEFATILGTSNKRHSEQRKLNEEERSQRSTRRAQKTSQAKQEKLQREQERAKSLESVEDEIDETDYDFDEA